MRWQAVIILIAITAGVAAPPSLPWLNADPETAIGELDLCHSAAPALSPSGDMPCVSECPCLPLPLAAVAVSETIHPSLKPLLIAFQHERPPQA